MVKKLIVAGVMIATSSVPGMAQDAQKGAAVFDVCKVCHAIGPGAQNKIGPELNGLDGRIHFIAAVQADDGAKDRCRVAIGPCRLSLYECVSTRCDS